MGHTFHSKKADKVSVSKMSPSVTYLFTSALCIITSQAFNIKTNDIEGPNSHSLRLFGGFCCGSVVTRCAQNCAGKSCDLDCSGTCGFFSSQCGPYKCGAVTNACISSTTTTTTTITTPASTTTTTTTTSTTTTTTTSSCIVAGGQCLSTTSGKVGDCCEGSSCTELVSGSGYHCSSTTACIASGSQCLSLTAGQVGDCCAGSSCSVFVTGAGFNCS